jgi:hypothetical protein
VMICSAAFHLRCVTRTVCGTRAGKGKTLPRKLQDVCSELLEEKKKKKGKELGNKRVV